MNKWQELKLLYKRDHLSKPLKKPQIRLNALEHVEEYIRQAKPQVINDPFNLQSIDRSELKVLLSKQKGRPLNAAEESVVNGLYKFLLDLGK